LKIQTLLHEKLCIALFGAACLLASGCSDDPDDNKNNTNPVADMKEDTTPDTDMDPDMDMFNMPDCGVARSDDMQVPCGGVDMQDMADMEPTPPTIDEALEAYGQTLVGLLCAQTFDCPASNNDLYLLLGRYADKAACEQDDLLLKQFLNEGLNGTKAAVAAGRQTYNADKAVACLDAFKALAAQDACAGLDAINDAPPAPCDEVFVGTVAMGDGCADGGDCAVDGMECARDGEACFGACLPPESSDCNGVVCGATQYCDSLNDSGNPVCTDKVALGAECDESDACQGDAICDVDYNADPDPNGQFIGTCVAPRSVAVGGECHGPQVCVVNALCDEDQGKCEAIDIAPKDDICVFGQTQCAPGTTCGDLEIMAGVLTGTCIAAKGDGGACIIFTECQPDLQCEGANPEQGTKGLCKPLRAVGAACDDDIQCASFACTNGQCVTSDAMICQVP
jgi:hypothetical protein